MRPSLFCFGLGYSATVLARNLMADGWTIGGTTRSLEKRCALQAGGMHAHQFARSDQLVEPCAAFASITHVLISIAPDEIGDPVIDCHLSDLIAADTIRWVGYLSTTGVYGNRFGGWVHETDPPDPSSPRSKRRVAAERRWLASGLPVHIFRLAGLYGPGQGRNALEAVRAGYARRIVKPKQVFSRIHVEDLVQVLRASIERPNPGAVYNVADDEPAPPQDVICYAAELLNFEPPPEIPFDVAEMSEAAKGFYADNCRVANDLIKVELGVELKHRNYRDGLKAILDNMALGRNTTKSGEGM